MCRSVFTVRGLWCCFIKQKTAYEMRISDWSSDVCASDLPCHEGKARRQSSRGSIRILRRELAGDGTMPSRGRARIAQGDLATATRTTVVPGFVPGTQWRQPGAMPDDACSPARRQQIGRASCRERGCHYV